MTVSKPKNRTDLAQVTKFVSDLMDNDQNEFLWVLLPLPIKNVTEKRLGEIIKGKRINLVHDDWQETRESAAELSDTGGVAQVAVYRVRLMSKIGLNSLWEDGKSRPRKSKR